MYLTRTAIPVEEDSKRDRFLASLPSVSRVDRLASLCAGHSSFHVRPPAGRGESITKVLVGLVLDRKHVRRHDLGRAFEVGDGLHTTDADGVGHRSVDHIDAFAGELRLRSLLPTPMIPPNRPSAHPSSNTRRTDFIDNSAQLEQLNAAINFLRIEVHIRQKYSSADRSTELDQLFQKL